jgi:hypothetical protein
MLQFQVSRYLAYLIKDNLERYRGDALLCLYENIKCARLPDNTMIYRRKKKKQIAGRSRCIPEASMPPQQILIVAVASFEDCQTTT